MEQEKSLTDKVADAVRALPEYTKFQDAERQLFRVPGLKAQADKLRREIYELNQTEHEDFLAATDEFRAEHAELLNNPEVAAYLRAEAALCGRLRRLYSVAASISDLSLPR